MLYSHEKLAFNSSVHFTSPSPIALLLSPSVLSPSPASSASSPAVCIHHCHCHQSSSFPFSKHIHTLRPIDACTISVRHQHVRLSYENREQLSPLPPANEHLALSATTTGRAHACPAIGHHIQLRAPCPYFVFSPPFVSQSRWFSCLPSFFSLFFLARLAYANYIPCRAVPYSLLRRYNNSYTYVHLCLPSVRSPHSLYTAPCAPRRACAFPSPKERTN